MRRLVLPIVALTALGACAGPEVRPEKAPETAAAAPEKTEAPAPSPDAVPTSEAWRAERPKPGPAPDLTLPTFEKAVLPNGFTVLVSRRPGLPIVSVGVALRAGSAAEPAKKAGLANLTWDLLLEGTKKMDALALDRAFADLGGTAGADTSYDGADVAVTLLSSHAEEATRLLADVVRHPRLAQKDFERKKKEHLADLARRVGSPNYLAQEAGMEAVFGKAHPYGHLTSGSPATVAAITHADVRRFYRAHAGPKAAALVVTGDVTLDQAKAWAKKYFGSWKGPARPTKAPAAPTAAPRTKIVLIPQPGLGQTVIFVGRPGLAIGNPDEWALEVANTAFGGAFSSRLNMNLREDKGYTYGAFGWVDERFGVGPMAAMTQVRADTTGDALRQIMAEVAGMRERPVTAEEMKTARDGVLKSLPGHFEQVQGLFNMAAGLYEKDQPLNRLEKMVSSYRGLQLDTVNAAAARYFDPATLSIVLVGDPKVIEAQVGELGLGEIEVRSPDGALATK